MRGRLDQGFFFSESGDDALATLESIADSIETPRWSGSAQVAAVTHTCTALILAGVLVANATLDEVAQGLRKMLFPSQQRHSEFKRDSY